MGQLYNKENKPTVSCRGIELYPSTSVGEVIWAGDTLVWYKNEGPPTSLYDVVWPSGDATEDDTSASYPVHTGQVMFVGFIPGMGPDIISEDIATHKAATNGLYFPEGPASSTGIYGLLLTTYQVSGNVPNSMGMWDIKNKVQVNDLTSLEDGFYPVSLWEDANYDGLFNYDYERHYAGKWLNIGGPTLNDFGGVSGLDIPCSWILKIGDRYLSYGYNSSECLYLGGYADLKSQHGVSTMEEARELEYKKMLEEAHT